MERGKGKERKRVFVPEGRIASTGQNPDIYKHGNTSPSAFELMQNVEDVQDVDIVKDVEAVESVTVEAAQRQSLIKRFEALADSFESDYEDARKKARIGPPDGDRMARYDRNSDVPATGDRTKPRARGNFGREMGDKHHSLTTPQEFELRYGMIVPVESQYDAHFGGRRGSGRRGNARIDRAESDKPEFKNMRLGELLTELLDSPIGIAGITYDEAVTLKLIDTNSRNLEGAKAFIEALETDFSPEWNGARNMISASIKRLEHAGATPDHLRQFIKRFYTDISAIWPISEMDLSMVIEDRLQKIEPAILESIEQKKSAA